MAQWPYRGAAHLVSALSPESIAPELSAQNAPAPASAVWPTANKAFFVPFSLSVSVVARSLWVLNGATATGNWDVAIYDNLGTRVVSTGSTLQAGVNVFQVVAIANTALVKGNYYLGMSSNSAALTVFRTNPAAGLLRATGMFVQLSAFPLPATATPVVVDAAHCPIFGFGVRATI